MRKVLKVVSRQATGHLHSICASVTGRLLGQLAFTGYGRTSLRLASVTGEAAWSLAMSFNEILLVDCHRYAERIVVCV